MVVQASGVLAVCLDCSGGVGWGEEGGFQQFVMQLFVFMNAHLSMKPGNTVALFGYKRGDRLAYHTLFAAAFRDVCIGWQHACRLFLVTAMSARACYSRVLSKKTLIFLTFLPAFSALLYPPPTNGTGAGDGEADDLANASADTGKHEPLSNFNIVALEQLNAFVLREQRPHAEGGGGSAASGSASATSARPPALAAAMAQALCYINTIQIGEANVERGGGGGGRGGGIAGIGAGSGGKVPGSGGRVLVISGHTDDTSQHPGMMSAVFAAKSKFVLCDACVVGPPSSILQQTTNLTKGLCVSTACARAYHIHPSVIHSAV